MEIIISAVIVLLFIFLGMSVALSFLTGSLFYMIITGASMSSIVPDALYSLDKYSLLAVPLFLIAGTLMEVSHIADKLIHFSRVLLQKIKGGLGAVIPVSSMFFGALSGSGTATVAALSNILIPRLEKIGWDKRYTAALLAASGPLGYMIPPNMNAILYGVVANASIAALFLATVIPGAIWGLLYIVINRVVYKKWYHPQLPEETTTEVTNKEMIAATEELHLNGNESYFKELFRSFKIAIPAFLMPVIIFGGIYGGVFTPTEAGAVGCIYAILAGGLIYRTLNLSNGFTAFINTGKLLGSIFFILPMVLIFTRLLVMNGVPQMITQGLSTISSNKHVILLFIIIIFIIAGFFLDAGILIFVFTPLILPTANAIGLDPIQLGVILFVSIGVGTITPPMAMNLFITSKASGVPIDKMIKPMLPFLFFGALPVLFLVTYIPEFSLWLPSIIMD